MFVLGVVICTSNRVALHCLDRIPYMFGFRCSMSFLAKTAFTTSRKAISKVICRLLNGGIFDVPFFRCFCCLWTNKKHLNLNNFNKQCCRCCCCCCCCSLLDYICFVDFWDTVCLVMFTSKFSKDSRHCSIPGARVVLNFDRATCRNTLYLEAK